MVVEPMSFDGDRVPSTPLPPGTPAQPIRTTRGTQPEASSNLIREPPAAVTAALLPQRRHSPRLAGRTQAGPAGIPWPLLFPADQVTARARGRPAAPRPLSRANQAHTGIGAPSGLPGTALVSGRVAGDQQGAGHAGILPKGAPPASSKLTLPSVPPGPAAPRAPVQE